jgi:hypothetical protein
MAATYENVKMRYVDLDIPKYAQILEMNFFSKIYKIIFVF